MLLQWNVSLNKQVLVQVWQSAANIKLATSMGYKVPPFPPSLPTKPCKFSDLDHCRVL
jgi:hypothetical protein